MIIQKAQVSPPPQKKLIYIYKCQALDLEQLD